MNFISNIILFLKGIVIGIANIIPGVSGGTMAVVMGIYDRLIEAIGGVLTDSKRRVSHFFFLVVVALGAIGGILLLAPAIEYSLNQHHALTMLFFMGLIIGSTPTIVKKSGLKSITLFDLFWLSLGIIVVLTLGASPESKESISASLGSVNTVLLFSSMILAGGAMIVPGVSGSLLMILLGQYPIILHAINQRNLTLLAIAGAGAALGVLIFSKIISFLLKHASTSTHSFIIGLVGGSVIVIYDGFPHGDLGWFYGGLIFLAGAGVAHLTGISSKSK
jgi:putative membrane protein